MKAMFLFLLLVLSSLLSSCSMCSCGDEMWSLGRKRKYRILACLVVREREREDSVLLLTWPFNPWDRSAWNQHRDFFSASSCMGKASRHSPQTPHRFSWRSEWKAGRPVKIKAKQEKGHRNSERKVKWQKETERKKKKNGKRFRVQAEGDLDYFHIKHVFFSHNHSYFISSQSWHVSLGKINALWQAPHMRAEAGSQSHPCIMQSCVRPIIASLTC